MVGFSMVRLLVCGVIVILLFSNRLPDVARSLGRSLVEFKRGMSNPEGESKRISLTYTSLWMKPC
jgi:sec-independent protein translocase protein TatA